MRIITRSFSNYTNQPWRQVLGVSSHATLAEVKQAHRALVLKHHPDVASNKEAKNVSENFQRIRKAYEEAQQHFERNSNQKLAARITTQQVKPEPVKPTQTKSGQTNAEFAEKLFKAVKGATFGFGACVVSAGILEGIEEYKKDKERSELATLPKPAAPVEEEKTASSYSKTKIATAAVVTLGVGAAVFSSYRPY